MSGYEVMFSVGKVLLSPAARDVMAIIMIVAALPMAGWSWAVNRMAGIQSWKTKEDK